MHTFTHKNGRIHHDNFDLAGNVIIQNSEGEDLRVSGEMLLEFLVEYLRNKVVTDVEQMDEASLIRAASYLCPADPGVTPRS